MHTLPLAPWGPCCSLGPFPQAQICLGLSSKISPAFPLLSLPDCLLPTLLCSLSPRCDLQRAPDSASCRPRRPVGPVLLLSPLHPSGPCPALRPSTHHGPLHAPECPLLGLSPPPGPKVSSVSCSCLQGLPPFRGLLHQSPQSKINEEKPNSQVQGLVKEKKQ